jgi:hypothetical protein
MSETPARSYIIDRTDEIDRLIASEIQADEGSRGIDMAADSKLDAILGNHV